MIKVGQRLSVVAVLGFLVVGTFATLSSLQPYLGSVWVNIAAFIAAWSGLIAWGMAIYHWAKYYPSTANRRMWGAVVIVLVGLGAWVYWFLGALRTSER